MHSTVAQAGMQFQKVLEINGTHFRHTMEEVRTYFSQQAEKISTYFSQDVEKNCTDTRDLHTMSLKHWRAMDVDRYVMRDLLTWKDNPRRKPLLLNGARQVGKTWLLQELGNHYFDSFVHVSLDRNPLIRAQFEQGHDLQRILEAIQIQSGKPVVPGKTLLVLDEIQECPKALTSLKFFCEQMPHLAVAAAGSLMGLTLHEGANFPVGKVNFIDVHPLCFGEYLDAVDQKQLRQLATSDDIQMIASFASDFEWHLKNYFFVGGMPEVVNTYVEQADYRAVRTIQEEILRGYAMDVSKHLSSTASEYTIAAWNSVPAHLSRKNKRFVFSHIAEGARARDYRAGITWLVSSGIAIKVPRVTKPGIPLDAYEQTEIFKLFAVDIGLLGAQVQLDVRTLLEGNTIFEEVKGALTEQFVCQELVSFWGGNPFYWSSPDSRAEVDFLLHRANDVFAVEVKADENLQSRSLGAFAAKFPQTHPLRFSLAGFRTESWMRNVPLYMIENEKCWVDVPSDSYDNRRLE